MRALLPLTAVILLGAVASPAHATWREQRLPSTSAASPSPPSLATDARGDVAVAWRAGRRSYLAVRRAGAKRFGRRIALRHKAAGVAVLSDGTVLVTTTHNDGTTTGRHPCCVAAYVQRLRPRSTRLTRARVMTVRGADFGHGPLAAGPGGRAALLGSSDGEIELVTSRRRGVFRAPADVGRAGVATFVGLGGDGRGVGLWVDGSNHEQRLRGAPIRGTGTPRASRTYIAAPDARSDFAFADVRAGLDGRSRLTVLWSDSGAVGVGLPGSLSVATGASSGAIGSRQVLATAAGLGAGISSPSLSVAPNGRAIAGWRAFGGATGEQTLIAVRNGPRARFHVLPVVAGGGFGLSTAMLSSGYGVVVNASGRSSVAASVVRRSGRVGTARRLRGIQQSSGAGVVAAAGRITLAWGTGGGLRVATFTPPRRRAR